MKIGFLFGFGITSKVLSSTQQITKSLLRLKAQHFKRKSNHYKFGNYRISKKENRTNSEVLRFINFLKDTAKDPQITKEIKNDINYEDIYYIAKQIEDCTRIEYWNPVVKFFISKNREFKNMRKSAKNTCELIEDFVVTKLNKRLSRKMKGRLDRFTKTIIRNPYDDIYIFSLNHDTLLEEYFTSKYKNEFSDGFKLEKKKWVFNKSIYDNKRIKLIKLHGSIDWFEDKKRNGEYVLLKINKSIKGSDSRKRNNKRAEILVGAFNKILSYSAGHYFRKLVIFFKFLEKIDSLVISGYSFNDKGINTILINRMFNSKSRLKPIVIDPKGKKLLTEVAREGIKKRYRKFKCFIVKPKPFEKVNWKKIVKLLGKNRRRFLG